jgi:hypothetical protein
VHFRRVTGSLIHPQVPEHQIADSHRGPAEPLT